VHRGYREEVEPDILPISRHSPEALRVGGGANNAATPDSVPTYNIDLPERTHQKFQEFCASR